MTFQPWQDVGQIVLSTTSPVIEAARLIPTPMEKEPVMEIAIIGPGEVAIRFIDSKGEMLMQETQLVSGSLSVEGRRTIDLSVWTTGGQRRLAPVLVR
ncbi:MAG: hypothetical protein AABZ34_04125 [Nitrospirota bacterium]